jgi:coproporphyrinogen III oxidase
VLPFVADAARSFVHAYAPIVEARHADAPPPRREARWQALRRGRYVEFNLVHDRGTKFGLATPGARIESILMSLPLEARWEYMADPEPGSPEDAALQILKAPCDWL